MGRRAGVLACAIWLLCGAYSARFLTRGWIPHDEGTIGQSADRILHGELPHRDFDELYTGGVSYLHAAAMRVLGINLVTPRLVLFLFFMLFLAVVHAVARRLSTPSTALAAMPLVTVWSVPNYFVSLPSWYTLFFATGGTLALLRYLESPRRGWLVAAGVCGGLSVLAKITGAYYLAAAVLFLIYLEQQQSRAVRPQASGRSWFALLSAVPGACLVLLLLQLPSLSSSFAFAPLFAPALVVCAFIVWREWTLAPSRPPIDRLRRLAYLVWPVVAGAAAVMLPFVAWYWQQGALPELVRGVLLQPQRRLVEASITPPSFAILAIAAPYAAVLLIDARSMKARESRVATLLAIGLGLILLLGNYQLAFASTFAFVRALPLVAAVVGVVQLAQPATRVRLSDAHAARVFLLVSMAGLLSLVQVPYASPTYFYYCAPVVALALLAIVSSQHLPPSRVHAVVAVFLLAFAVFYTNQSYGWNLGVKFIPYSPSAPLAVDRGGLAVPDDDAKTYGELVKLVRAHAAGGTIYAAPDCPEVYFLSGFANPTRTIFEFLSAARQDDVWTLDLLRRAPVRAVVINNEPLVSPRLDPAAVSVLETRFPTSQQVGRFTVRW
jgi:Dolichyl-phosphate-mannose-protein mannosyltransferase